MIEEITQNGQIVQVRARTLGVNAYLLIYDEYLIVVDSLLLPSDSQELCRIAMSYQKPIRYLINTHYHSDHCIGNRYIKQPETIQINHEDYWATIVNERSMINPRKSRPVDHKRLTQADLTIRGEYRELENLVILPTPGHSADSICLYLSEQKILIAGDTLISNTSESFNLPYFYWGNSVDLISSLHTILELEICTIYSGHGYPVTKEKAERDLRYLNNLSARFKELYHSGATSLELVEKISISDCLESCERVAVKSVHELNIRGLIREFEKGEMTNKKK